MRSSIATRDLLPESLHPVRIWASPRANGSRCPVCGRDSSRVQSRYSRNVSDLPWHGISVELEVRARHFFCDEASCERQIFCARLPDVAARARKTDRLEEAPLATRWNSGAGRGRDWRPSWNSSSGAPCRP